MKKIALIKELIQEWHSGKISDNQAMWTLSVIVYTRKPSKKVAALMLKTLMEEKLLEDSVNEQNKTIDGIN